VLLAGWARRTLRSDPGPSELVWRRAAGPGSGFHPPFSFRDKGGRGRRGPPAEERVTLRASLADTCLEHRALPEGGIAHELPKADHDAGRDGAAGGSRRRGRVPARPLARAVRRGAPPGPPPPRRRRARRGRAQPGAAQTPT